MYVGQQPVVGRYILLDQISGGFNGTATGFTMTAGGQGVIPGLAQNVLLSLGGVIQQPGVDYLVSGSGLTFTTAPVSGTTFFATVLGDAQAVGTPSDGTVIPASIASSGTFVFPNVTVSGVTTIASGSAAAPSLSISGDANTGLYSAGADQLSIATSGTARLSIDGSGNINILQESAGPTYPEQRLKWSNDSTTANGFYISQGTDRNGKIWHEQGLDIQFATSNTERMRLDSSGRLGIGTSAPAQLLHVKSSSAYGVIVADNNGATGGGLFSSYQNGAQKAAFGVSGSIEGNTTSDLGLFADSTGGAIRFYTNGSPAAKAILNSSGQLGIGTTSPGALLHAAGKIRFGSNTTYYGEIDHDAASTGANIYDHSDSGGHIFRNGGQEALRIDGSKRLLVGTSTSASAGQLAAYSKLQVVGNTISEIGIFSLARNEAASGITAGEALGAIAFVDSDGNDYAWIQAFADGTAGTNDYPGRLSFWTTADGASSPTERMRITSGGDIHVAKTSTGVGTVGCTIQALGTYWATRSGGALGVFNRQASDGNLIEFYQDDALEGTISVSGTTVSYNGAHLSRWSQLPSGQERTEILRGTVLSNIDEMCEWGEEDNEQLNRMKMSDVEGDPNVAGVFQGWDDDDDTYINDFYCAMTGDFIIRIGAGVTVERGDLLMSAGDGTAKPQGDDIVRSKTVAKVISTNVSCTYEDGSYCVPCVLMAC